MHFYAILSRIQLSQGDVLVQIRAEIVRDLQTSVNKSETSVADRSLMVRRFCNEYKPNGPAQTHAEGDEGHWTKVDTDHLLTISSDMALLSNYLVERMVAAS